MVRDRKEIPDQVKSYEKNEELKKGIVVGPSFEFLFEEENNDYDEKYADHI
ncbi:hypothetical protein [Sutcliffiella horikoshii]|uniref:hypothetical protein n=1 Tax=Sutcliffiella horikoshii TaxID=79883 RepID=UPI003CF48247